MDLEVVDVGDAEPCGGIGLVLVRTGLICAAGWGGNGVEAQCELLVNGVVGVDQDVGGVAVDTGEAGELDGDADSSATSRTTVATADSPTSMRPPGSSQLPSSIRRTSSSSPAPLRTAANAADKTS